MPTIKGVARNRLRTEQKVTPADKGGNFVGGALNVITDMINNERSIERQNQVAGLKAQLKESEELLKEVQKLPPVEKRKEAKQYFEREIETNRDLKGAIRGINKSLDVRKLDAERDDIYRFAVNEGENPEDALTKIIRSEEELLGILENDNTYTMEEKKQMLEDYKKIGNQKSTMYQAIWKGIENNYTKEEMFRTVGIIKDNSSMLDIEEKTNMTKVLVEAGIEAGTLSNSEASTIMATIGDSNLNQMLEGIRDADVSDAERTVAYGMIEEAIQTRSPEFFQNLGYEPFSYGTASTQLNNFKSKMANEVAVNRQELRKLEQKKKTNFTEFWQERGNSFNGDYRTTRDYTESYIKETAPQLLEAYQKDPSGTMEEAYIENALPDFNYLSEAEREQMGAVMNDENTPHDRKFGLQKAVGKRVLGEVPYGSIEYEIYNQQMYEQGGYSPELMTGIDKGENPNMQNVAEKIQAGKFLNQGALGRLDALTLMEAVRTSKFTDQEVLGLFNSMNLLRDEAGYNRMAERFQTEFSRLLSYHLKKGTSTMEDQTFIDKALRRTRPTEALLSGGYPTDIFEAIISSDEFTSDMDTLMGAYLDGRTIMQDDVTNEPVVLDIEGVTQEIINDVRSADSKKAIYYFSEGTYHKASDDMKDNMVLNSMGSTYGYYLQGGEAYEKLDSGEFVPFRGSVQSFDGSVTGEETGIISPFFKKMTGGIVNMLGRGSEVEGDLEKSVISGEDKRPLPNYLTGQGFTETPSHYPTKNAPTELREALKTMPPTSRKMFEDLQGFIGLDGEAYASDYSVPQDTQENANILYNKLYTENRRSEGVYPERYKSKEGGTDTIGVGHKMTKAEHDGNYVVINGMKRDLKTPLTTNEIEQLFRQDYKKSLDRVQNRLLQDGINYDDLTDEFKEIAFRITFNAGQMFSGMVEGIKNNDLQQFNTSLISNVRFTDQGTGQAYTSAGLARDRARYYNMVNDVPIDYVVFTKEEGGGSRYTYFDVYGQPVGSYTRKFPLKTGKNGNSYNKKYFIER